MFSLFPKNLKFPFMKVRLPMMMVSVIAVVLSLYFLATKGLRYGVDFAGGIEIILSFPKDSDVNSEKLRASLKRINIADATVQAFGTEFKKKEAEYMVHFSGDFTQEEKVLERIQEAFAKAGEKKALVSNFRFSGMEKAYLKLSESRKLDDVLKMMESVSFGILELL